MGPNLVRLREDWFGQPVSARRESGLAPQLATDALLAICFACSTFIFPVFLFRGVLAPFTYGRGSKDAIFFHCVSVGNGAERAIGPPPALLTLLIPDFAKRNH